MDDKGNVAQAQPEQATGLKIVEVVQEGGKIVVTVESDSVSQLVEGEARKLAYEERLKHGMAQAGIEAVGGTYVPEKEQTAAKAQGRDIALWRADFRLTPMI